MRISILYCFRSESDCEILDPRPSARRKGKGGKSDRVKGINSASGVSGTESGPSSTVFSSGMRQSSTHGGGSRPVESVIVLSQSDPSEQSSGGIEASAEPSRVSCASLK